MKPTKVVYLFGAGATHGCLEFVGSRVGLLMQDINPPLLDKLRSHIQDVYADHKGLQDLVFGVLDTQTDYEHVLTFLEQSPSSAHRAVASTARQLFYSVLRNAIGEAVQQHGGRIPNDLYSALLDLHAIDGFPEEITGLITLNYDGFLEDAIERAGRYDIEWGVAVASGSSLRPTRTALPLVKLHGSFEWGDSFPVKRRALGDSIEPLWIPPGVVKEKERYPFNLLWGRVREMLDCDVLRIVGWNMGPNDWDLISLLFSTRHANDDRPAYRIELIGSPKTAECLTKRFPYLGVKSILETDRAGEALIGEYLQRGPTRFENLGPDDQEKAVKAAGRRRNWFLEWLKRNLEWAHINLDIDSSLSGALKVLEEVA